MRTPRRGLSAALAAAVGLSPLALLVAPPPAGAAVTDIRINEIITDSADVADSVELMNTGTEPVDVAGMLLRDSDDAADKQLVIGGGATTIAPGGFLAIVVDLDDTGFGLGNGDGVRLYSDDTATTLLDSQDFPGHSDPSWSLCPDGSGPLVQASAETLGEANDCPAAEDLVVNEVESSGDPAGDWVELGNPTGADIDASGLVLRDADPENPALPVPEGTVVAAGGYAQVFTEPTAETGFGLGGTDSVTLFAADGTTEIDGHAWTGHAGTTYGRCPDLLGDFAPTGAATPGAANDCPLPGGAEAVKVNEVESNGDATDWVEIVNTGETPIDVSGWIVRDNDDNEAATVPAGTTLAPGGFHAIDTDVATGSTDFGLGGNDQARLFLPDGITLVDSYAWSTHADVTYGRCPDGTGEFATTLASSRAAANICAAAFDPADIRLNEVESNGDVVADWVELTNVGDTPADISGWKLIDADPEHPFAVVPDGTVLLPGAFFALYTEFPPPGFGLGSADTVTLFQADGTSEVDSFGWTDGHAATTYGRCPDGTGEWQVTTVSTRGTANACSPIRINEIESSDPADGPDWVELVNLSEEDQSVEGWMIKDAKDDEEVTTLGALTVPAGGHLLVDDLAAGLGSGDSARLFDPTGKQVDGHTWTAHAAVTYGRCSDGVGIFVDTVTATPGEANDCPGLATVPWPGSQEVATSDLAETFGQDASGVTFDPTEPDTLWVAQNKAGTLRKLTKDVSGETPTWVPAEGWADGRDPKYADGTGAPDTEGITIGPDGAVYLASERNNDVSGVSKNTVLRYEPGETATATMSATDEWDISPLLPETLGANLGLEGITWIPDTYLTEGGLVDESTTEAYDPADYPDHGDGLYGVVVEGTGLLYLLALDQTDAVAEDVHLVATVDPQLVTNAGSPSAMDVAWDPERRQVWVLCDDSCDGTSVTMDIDEAGAFGVVDAYDRPLGMPNLNNEGLAIAPQSTCVGGSKEVVWSDDGDTDGHALRSGTLPCTEVVPPGKAFEVVSEPSTTGRPIVGNTILGEAGNVTPWPGRGIRYQWLADGEPVAGGRGEDLTIPASVLGSALSLQVTYTLEGYDDLVLVSEPTAAVRAGTLSVRQRPVIVGKAKPGRVLRARLGAVAPAATAATVRWYVDGRLVERATTRRLEVRKAMRGKRIRVNVTVTRAGYAPRTLVSAPVRVRRR